MRRGADPAYGKTDFDGRDAKQDLCVFSLVSYLSFCYEPAIFLFEKREERSLIFLTGAVLYVITARVLPYKPNLFPMLPYNADCALYYMIFYCTGYCLFPKMQELLQEEGKSRNIVLAAVGILGGVYAVCLFFGKDGLAALLRLPVIRIFHPYLSAMILILWNTALAFSCKKAGSCKSSAGKACIFAAMSLL